MKRYEVEPLSTRQILKCALQNEKMAWENYDSIGELLRDERNTTAAKIFFEAAKVEKGHFKKLQKALKRLYGEVIDDTTPFPYSTACIPGSGDNKCLAEITLEMGEEEAIRFLEESETMAESFYRKAVENTDRPDLKALFRMMAQEEARHRKAVRKIARTALRRPTGTDEKSGRVTIH